MIFVRRLIIKIREFRVNEQIRVKKVRLINYDGTQLGIVNIEEALERARECGLDLAEVQPNSDPPVCKILDFGKFKFEMKKRAHKAKKKQHIIQLKEIQLRTVTEKHDVDFKVNHAKQFLTSGKRVLFSIVLKGREKMLQDPAKQMLENIATQLADFSKIEKPIFVEGPYMRIILAPK